MAALVNTTTNITLAAMTGFVGIYGTNAIAGYGAGARLEFLFTFLSYGIGGPAAIVIGTNIGAGKHDRALKASWIAVIVAGFACETIGVCAAVWPAAWLGIFSTDPEVVAVGSSYLRTVGPFFGLFGVGYALYCAGQGTGRMEWPVAGAVVRAVIAVLAGARADSATVRTDIRRGKRQHGGVCVVQPARIAEACGLRIIGGLTHSQLYSMPSRENMKPTSGGLALQSRESPSGI